MTAAAKSTLSRSLRIVSVTREESWRGGGQSTVVAERLTVRSEDGMSEMSITVQDSDIGSFRVGMAVTVGLTEE